MSTSTLQSPENVAGAVIFFSYIIAALGLTGLVVSDLSKAYGAYSKSKVNTTHRSNLILAFASFAAISFSALSYHMLNVLTDSYAAWAVSANVPLPSTFVTALSGLTNGELSIRNVWTWVRSSSLFQDFAEVICDDPFRFWWTQQALLLSVGWNTFMAIEGTKCDIPRLWAYFLLDQILPVSFTLNLFCLALLLAPPLKSAKKLYATVPFLQILTLLTYFFCVSQAPANVGTPWFLPTLFATRALLFAPYLVLAPSSERTWRTPVGQMGGRGTLHEAYRPAWMMVFVCTAVMYVRQYKLVLEDDHKSAIWEGFRTINHVPAVSTLAYDYILGLGSLYIFWATT